MVIEPRLSVLEQPRPAADRLPALQYLGAQRPGVDPLVDEPQLMSVGMPAVRAVGQLQGAD